MNEGYMNGKAQSFNGTGEEGAGMEDADVVTLKGAIEKLEKAIEAQTDFFKSHIATMSGLYTRQSLINAALVGMIVLAAIIVIVRDSPKDLSYSNEKGFRFGGQVREEANDRQS